MQGTGDDLSAYATERSQRRTGQRLQIGAWKYCRGLRPGLGLRSGHWAL